MHKLLFDNNISYKVLKNIEDIFPNSSHVMHQKLDFATDLRVWQFAKQHHFTIITKDSDFNELAIYKGIPPKIIWLKTGNCKVAYIELLLKENQEIIKSFIENPTDCILEI